MTTVINNRGARASTEEANRVTEIGRVLPGSTLGLRPRKHASLKP